MKRRLMTKEESGLSNNNLKVIPSHEKEEEYICECGYKTNSAYFMVRHLSKHSVKEIINNYEKRGNPQ